MFERFTTEARAVVIAASREAAEARRDRHIGTEHLLIGVVAAGNPTASRAGLTVEELRRALARLDAEALGAVGVEVDLSAMAEPGPERRRRWWRRGSAGAGHIPFTTGAKKCLERSLHIAIDLNHRQISSDHLLAAIAVAGGADPAVNVLAACGLDPAQLEAEARASLSRRAS